MILKSYTYFKDINIIWLSMIPKDWSILRLNSFVLFPKNQISPLEIKKKQVLHYSIPSVQESNVGKIEDGSNIDSNKFIVNKNDFVLSKLNPHKQTMTIIKEDHDLILGSSEFIVFRGYKYNKFLEYLFLSSELYSFLCSHVESATRSHQRVNPSIIYKLKVPIPSDKEIIRIISFLDCETAKIDTFIKKQKKMIELLKEKRQAMISHAITKGLNPGSPMKDSGIEWLGEVPEYWKLNQLRYLCATYGGGTPSKDIEEFWKGNIPWVSPKDMKTEVISDSIDHISERAVQESSTKFIPLDSILMVVRGMILIHSVPVAKASLDLTINQDMKAFVAGNKISSDYLLCLFQGLKTVLLDLVEDSAHGTKRLNTDDLLKLKLYIPPLEEQKIIVQYIGKKKQAIDRLISKAEKSISLLQEKRTALISAAVTGKIDVRDWKKPEDEA